MGCAEAPVSIPRGIATGGLHYKWRSIEHADVYTDTDWAGCATTRTSTSGGCVIPGTHAANNWSSTQAIVALSSGEAEFNGAVRGAGV